MEHCFKNQHECISPEILDAIKTRDIHKSLGNTVEYKFWRNNVISLIKRAKRDQYQSFIENNKVKPGSIYKIFQEVGAGKVLTIGNCQPYDLLKVKILTLNILMKLPMHLTSFFVYILQR